MYFCISSYSRNHQVYIPPSIILVDTHPDLDISQKEWLTDAVNLVSRLGVVLGVLDTAVNQNDTGRMSPGEPHEKRQTYLLLSSCKLFCMTARARIYMETSKLPIVPRDQVKKFRNLSGESTQAFLQIFKTFNQVDDLRHLDYFIVVGLNCGLLPLDVIDDHHSRVFIIFANFTWHSIQANSIGTLLEKSIIK